MPFRSAMLQNGVHGGLVVRVLDCQFGRREVEAED